MSQPEYLRLHSGLDSLNVRIILDSPDNAWLSSGLSLQQQSIEAYRGNWNSGLTPPDLPVPEIGLFQQHPKTHPPYRYTFFNPEIADIYLWGFENWGTNQAHQTGQIYIEFRSNWLYYNQDRIPSAIELIVRAITPLPIVSTLVSRLDLHVTFTGYDFSRVDPFAEFVTRSRKLNFETIDDDRLNSLSTAIASTIADTMKGAACNLRGFAAPVSSAPAGQQGGFYVTGVTLDDLTYLAYILDQIRLSNISAWSGRNGYQTIYFGRFTSPIYARLYNKTIEVAVSNKEFLRDDWTLNRWNGIDSVWRLEFSCSGDFLKNHDLSLIGETSLQHLETCLDRLPELWSYLTQKWLRHIIPETHSRIRCCKTSPIWQFLQESFPLVVPLRRATAPRHIDIEQLKVQIEGCLLSHSAKLSSVFGMDSDKIFRFAISLFDWQESKDFQERLRERMLELGLLQLDQSYDLDNQFSDLEFSAGLRSDRYANGLSS